MGDDPEHHYARKEKLIQSIKNEMKHLDVLNNFKKRHDSHLDEISAKTRKTMASTETAKRKSFWSNKKEMDKAEASVATKSKALIDNAALISSDISQAFASESG